MGPFVVSLPSMRIPQTVVAFLYLVGKFAMNATHVVLVCSPDVFDHVRNRLPLGVNFPPNAVQFTLISTNRKPIFGNTPYIRIESYFRIAEVPEEFVGTDYGNIVALLPYVPEIFIDTRSNVSRLKVSFRYGFVAEVWADWEWDNDVQLGLNVNPRNDMTFGIHDFKLVKYDHQTLISPNLDFFLGPDDEIGHYDDPPESLAYEFVTGNNVRWNANNALPSSDVLKYVPNRTYLRASFDPQLGRGPSVRDIERAIQETRRGEGRRGGEGTREGERTRGGEGTQSGYLGDEEEKEETTRCAIF